MLRTKKLAIGVLTMGAFLVSSCSETSINSPTPENDLSSPTINAEIQSESLSSLEGPRSVDLDGMESMDDINVKLAEEGLNIRLAYAETVTKEQGMATAAGQTIYANDREKRLTAQWVPGDDRREADGNNLTTTIFDPFAPANFGFADQFDGSPAINASWDTWNNVKQNSKLDIIPLSNTDINPSAILGGDPFLADISTFGFVPPIFMELFVGPGSSSNVLGVTFTFVFIDEDGNPTDINNDGYEDTALKEVWYNDGFVWTDQGDAATGTDVETVALHENGHALGFGHFGKISVTDNNGKLHVSPRAVMNAIVLGEQRNLLGTDKASYNSIYGDWPQN